MEQKSEKRKREKGKREEKNIVLPAEGYEGAGQRQRERVRGRE